MKISINKLNVELKDISTAHDQVNTYFWGDFGMAINSGVITYPLVNCFYPTGSMLDNTTPLDLYIVVSDKVYKDQSNLTETESDTLQICRDYYNVINKSDRWNRIGKINNATITKFLHEGRNGADEVAGHVLKINFALRDSNSICNIPLTGYDFEGFAINVSCADAVVKNSDLTYIQNIISGGFLTLPDITVTALNSEDTEIFSEIFPSVKNVLISIVDGILVITNSEDTVINSIPTVAGKTQGYQLPDTILSVFVNGNPDQSVIFATLSNQTINITN